MEAILGSNGVGGKSWNSQVALVYAMFFAVGLFVFHVVAEGEFSGVLTLSAMTQCLAYVLLVIQIVYTGSATGISARCLALDAMALCCRLSSTTWLLGYLPADASGDYVYQLTDIFSLLAIMWLLYQMLIAKRHIYDEYEDNFPAAPLAILSLVCGAIFHADLNSRPLFDALWMTSIFVSVLSAMPQLSLISRAGGLKEALTTHHVAALAVSRIMSGLIMWGQREDLTCDEWIEGLNHALIAVLFMHAVHLLLLADFFYFYFSSMVRDGVHVQLTLDSAQWV